MKTAMTVQTEIQPSKPDTTPVRGPEFYSHPGAKASLPPHAIAQIRAAFDARHGDKVRDRAIFETAISTMLRSSDFVDLKVATVATAGGKIRDEISVKQKKTDTSVTVVLNEEARAAIAALIAAKKLGPKDYLFTAEDAANERPRKPRKQGHITTKTVQRLVKTLASDWCGLDDVKFSAHSLRKALPAALYAQTNDIVLVQRAIGHASAANTSKYLGIDQQKALDIVKTFKI